VNYQNYGFFFQLHSSSLRVAEFTLGGRFDYNTLFGGVFNPRLGVVLKLDEKLKVKILYGTSFLAPSPWKAYSTFGSFDVTTSGGTTEFTSSFFHLPNVNLRPERLTSGEVNLFFFCTKQLNFSFGGYYNSIKDLINIQAPQGSGVFKGVSVAYVEKAINQGLAHTYGGTATVSYTEDIARAKLHFTASYSYTNGAVDNKPLVLAAKNTIKSSIDWSYPRLSFSLRFIYRGESNSVIVDTANQYQTNKPFSVLNLFTRYTVLERKKISASVNARVNNILNARYYHVAAGQDSFYATPQDPLRAELGLTLAIK
jgi:outer membrane receptor for ferrienterochelin and colicin